MSLWIKICGNTSLEDAMLAAEAGADAIGFVFAPSPRQVTCEQVAKFLPQLPAPTEKIGVFVDTTFDEIEAIVSACNLTGVQLQFAANPDLRSQLRDRVRLQSPHPADACTSTRAIDALAASLASDTNIDALLVDSRTATAVGGTGIAFDWKCRRLDPLRQIPTSPISS